LERTVALKEMAEAAISASGKSIGLVQEPAGSLTSLAEFAAIGGKFQYFRGKLFRN
jgi:hypothetical protein